MWVLVLTHVVCADTAFFAVSVWLALLFRTTYDVLLFEPLIIIHVYTCIFIVLQRVHMTYRCTISHVLGIRANSVRNFAICKLYIHLCLSCKYLGITGSIMFLPPLPHWPLGLIAGDGMAKREHTCTCSWLYMYVVHMNLITVTASVMFTSPSVCPLACVRLLCSVSKRVSLLHHLLAAS